MGPGPAVSKSDWSVASLRMDFACLIHSHMMGHVVLLKTIFCESLHDIIQSIFGNARTVFRKSRKLSENDEKKWFFKKSQIPEDTFPASFFAGTSMS